MTSKQFNFFVTPDDDSHIVSFFEKQNVKFLKNTGIKKSELITDQILVTDNKMPRLIFLTYDIFLSNIYFDFDENKSVYRLDRLKSYLVEFDFGGIHPNNPKAIDRGRFYYKKSYYASNGETIEKEIEFVKWADNLIKTFKKTFLKKSAFTKYILFSNNAANILEKNAGTVDKAGLKIILI